MKIKFFIISLILCTYNLSGFGQTSNPVFHAKFREDFGFRSYLINEISHMVDIVFRGTYNITQQNVVFFFKFNVDSTGKVHNVHFSNGDPPENYNNIKIGLNDSMRTIELNHLIDSALRNPTRHGYWTPAKKNGIPCESKTMFAQVIYYPHSSKGNDPNGLIENFSGLMTFFNSKGEDLIYLGYAYADGHFIQ